MNLASAEHGALAPWPVEGATRIPYRAFFDPAIYAQEQERIFRGRTWNYVGLEAEVPNAADFKATFVGGTPIVITRDKEGALHGFVNRCAHRGAVVCREPRGNRVRHQCVYHQWTYDLEGNLVGVPFRGGVGGKGGYPSDFQPAEHSLRKLRVETYKGLIFASFAEDIEPLETYLGPDMRHWLDRLFSKPIQVLGYARQYIHANWKLYAENTRDPYHASLLHLFHTTFGIYRVAMGGGVIMDETKRHDMLRAFRISEAQEKEAYRGKDIRTYQEQYTLADPSLLHSRKEFDVELTNHIQSIFPCLVVQQIQNTLATRHILPKKADEFELLFTFFGYEDDDAELRAIRIKQANLVGPAGYISMEDGHAAELVQQAIVQDQDAASFIEFGGRHMESEENLLTESAIRGFWQYYREIMHV